MSELISGKEAWIAKSDGFDVEWKFNGLDWDVLTDNQFYNWQTERFLDGGLGYIFRLKPKTININGIEVPAPFKPNKGDEYYFIYPMHECWYGCSKYTSKDEDCKYMIFGVWRTREEIKQVIEALRSISNVI